MPLPVPPRYANIPAAALYDTSLPDGAARFLMQVIGLHWDENNPPAPTMKDLMALTGKAERAIYGYLSALRTSGWLLFSTAQDGTYKFDLSPAYCKFLQSPLINSSSGGLINTQDKDSLINGGLQNFAVKGEKRRDPLLDNDAVKAYRAATHLTANFVQRKQIAEAVKDAAAWRECLEHWLGHGWSPTNVSGMLNSYSKGGKKACSQCGRSNGRGNGRPAGILQPATTPLPAWNKAQLDAALAAQDAAECGGSDL